MDILVTQILRGLTPEQYRAKGPRFLILFNRSKADIINIFGGAKGLIDALVAKGVLVDDSPKWLKFAAVLPAGPHPDPKIKATFFIGDVP